MSAPRPPRTLITAERSRSIRATAEVIFALLADPASLAGLMPRVERVEVLRRGDVSARVRTHMRIGPLGSVAAEGEVHWEQGSALIFRATRPPAVESAWRLAPDGAATLVRASMALDLMALLGPLAALVPPSQVTAVIGPDLDAALAALARRVER